jgi:hypothetical protein
VSTLRPELSKNVEETRYVGYLPTYSNITNSMFIEWHGREYEVREANPELLLTMISVVQR